MSRCGLRRYFDLDRYDRCPRCQEVMVAVYRLHPLHVPQSLGRGLWLTRDCACVRKSRQEQRARLARFTETPKPNPLPVGLRRHSFANFQTGPYNEEGYKYCVQFARNFDRIKNGEGLLIYGLSGTGKTHLACAIINSLKDKHWVSFAYVPALLERMRNSGVDLNAYLNPDLLVLDDLGSERETDWTIERMLIIVEGRLTNLKPTVFTTNYDLTDLERRIGMRLYSRIAGSNLKVLLQGPDHRLARSQ